jgi:hypothetical protein
MSITHCEYWPFAGETANDYLSLTPEELAFLESTTRSGFQAFRFGINDYGARSSTREGCILERGRRRWEIRLAEGEDRHLLAYVAEFRAAGQAVTEWLCGSCVQEILMVIRDHLTTPPGTESSYTIFQEPDSRRG